MAQRPCRSGATEPAIRSLNTGSPSKRGMQVHTCVPLASISDATWQFPVIARSRFGPLAGAGFTGAGFVGVGSGIRHFQQPAAQLVGARQAEFGRGGGLIADPQADAAESVHYLEGVLIGGVVTGEYRNAIPKRCP